MIKINFQEPDTNNWKAWKAQCEQEQEEHNAAIEAGQEDEVKKDIYDGKQFNIKSDIYKKIEGPFNGKCAYCESNIASDQDVEIDHFRPKNAVSDINFNPVKIEENGETRDHPGYYWLCYYYKNLLPSCILCNQKRLNEGKPTGKSTRFPVKGQHARLPGEEEQEEPLLINPVFDDDDPEQHLKVDDTGIIRRKNKSPRGQACIDVFGLNARHGLIDERKRVYDRTKDLIGLVVVAVMNDYPDTQGRLEKFWEIWNGIAPFSIAGRAVILKRFSPEKLPLLLKLFEQLTQNT